MVVGYIARRHRHRRHAAQLRDCLAGQPFTPKSPRSVVEMVERIYIPRCAEKAHEISV
jgi:hypothetical protein